MARKPKKASKGNRAKKGKVQDLPAGRKAKGVKGGATMAEYGMVSSSTLTNTTLTPSSLNFSKW